MKKTLPNEKAKLENLLAEKILTKTAYLKSATAKNRFEFLSQLSKRNLRIKYGFAFALRRCQPTVCVTRAGAGGGTPSDWKNDEA
jgi:hypothetical protein